jgi:hypothetical protein
MCVWVFLEWRDLIFPAMELSQGHLSGRKTWCSDICCCIVVSLQIWVAKNGDIFPHRLHKSTRKFSHLSCYWEYRASIFRDVEFSLVGVDMRVIATSLWATSLRGGRRRLTSWFRIELSCHVLMLLFWTMLFFMDSYCFWTMLMSLLLLLWVHAAENEVQVLLKCGVKMLTKYSLFAAKMLLKT